MDSTTADEDLDEMMAFGNSDSPPIFPPPPISNPPSSHASENVRFAPDGAFAGQSSSAYVVPAPIGYGQSHEGVDGRGIAQGGSNQATGYGVAAGAAAYEGEDGTESSGGPDVAMASGYGYVGREKQSAAGREEVSATSRGGDGATTTAGFGPSETAEYGRREENATSRGDDSAKAAGYGPLPGYSQTGRGDDDATSREDDSATTVGYGHLDHHLEQRQGLPWGEEVGYGQTAYATGNGQSAHVGSSEYGQSANAGYGQSAYHSGHGLPAHAGHAPLAFEPTGHLQSVYVPAAASTGYGQSAFLEQTQSAYPGQSKSTYVAEAAPTGHGQLAYLGQAQSASVPATAPTEYEQSAYSGQEQSAYSGQEQSAYSGQGQSSYSGQEQSAYSVQKQSAYSGQAQSAYAGYASPAYAQSSYVPVSSGPGHTSSGPGRFETPPDSVSSSYVQTGSPTMRPLPTSSGPSAPAPSHPGAGQVNAGSYPAATKGRTASERPRGPAPTSSSSSQSYIAPSNKSLTSSFVAKPASSSSTAPAAPPALPPVQIASSFTAAASEIPRGPPNGAPVKPSTTSIAAIPVSSSGQASSPPYDQAPPAPSTIQIQTSSYAVTGEASRGVLNGVGVLTRSNGDTFAGKFAKDRMENGTYSYSQDKAKRYRGSFKESLPSGTGTLEFANGDVYEGAFEAGKVQGTGRYAFKNGDILAGSFDDGRPVKGMKVTASGHRYLGEFHPTAGGGRFHGIGRLLFSNGDAYEGTFSNGSFHGDGQYRFADGMQIACATWVNNEPTGPTYVSLPDGTMFHGSFFAERRKLVESRGAIRFSDGSWFESRGFKHTEELPKDLDGGGFLFDAHTRVKRWVSVESTASRPMAKSVWIALPGRKSLGLEFCSSGSHKNETTSLDTSKARLILSTHQHMQFTLSPTMLGESSSVNAATWVMCSDTEERPRDVTVERSVRAVVDGEARRAFCLLGAGGDDPVTVAKAAAKARGVPNVSVVQFNDANSNENENDPRLHYSSSVFPGLSSAKPGLIILGLKTGFSQTGNTTTASTVQWLVSELLAIQSKLVVIWLDGDVKRPIDTASACSSAVLELIRRMDR